MIPIRWCAAVFVMTAMASSKAESTSAALAAFTSNTPGSRPYPSGAWWAEAGKGLADDSGRSQAARSAAPCAWSRMVSRQRRLPETSGVPRHVLPPIQEPHKMIWHKRHRAITECRQRAPKSTRDDDQCPVLVESYESCPRPAVLVTMPHNLPVESLHPPLVTRHTSAQP